MSHEEGKTGGETATEKAGEEMKEVAEEIVELVLHPNQMLFRVSPCLSRPVKVSYVLDEIAASGSCLPRRFHATCDLCPPALEEAEVLA